MTRVMTLSGKELALHELFLRTSLAYFAKHILNMEIAGHHSEWSDMVGKSHRTCVLASRDHGKTNHFSNKVLLSDGSVKTIAEVEPGEYVLSLNEETMKCVKSLVEHKQYCGKKSCVKITTRSGRETKLALTHPLRRYDGWVKAGDLEVGDRIATPRVLPLGLKEYHLSDAEIEFAGHFIANGCGVKVTPDITSEKFFNRVKYLSEVIGLDYAVNDKGMSFRKARVFLEKLNLLGKKSIDKTAPEWVFKLSERQLCLFLRGLYADGSISIQNNTTRGKVVGKQIAIELCLASKELVHQARHLLLRCGILGNISEKKLKYVKKDGTNARAWRLMITGKENQIKFLEKIGFPEDQEKVAEALEINKSMTTNGQNDLIPKECTKHMTKSQHWHHVNTKVGLSGGDINRHKLMKIAKSEKNEYLERLADSDILWDKIISIEPIGEHDCYDLQVAETHNYVCDDIYSHNSFFFSFAYPIWRAYYNWIPPLPSEDFKSIPRTPLGYIFSASQEKANEFLDIIKTEIETNDALAKLRPSHRDNWSKKEIRTGNGTVIRARGWGVSVRGGHPGWLVADDVLNDENLYSELSREKSKEYFFSAVTPMVIPGGQICVVGTPMSATDLYADLESNKEYLFGRFPAHKNNWSEALWPTRYTLEMLRRRQEEVGTVRFAREFECIPVSDDSALFPEKVIRECYHKEISLVTEPNEDIFSNYDIYTGVDLAMSSAVGADYTVITTIGVDAQKNRRILDIRRFKGRSMTDQLREIEDVYYTLRPNMIYIEDNQFQRVFRDELVSRTALPVKGFTTRAQNKNSLERGIPSLQVLFENAKIQIPRATERDRRITDVLVHELRCFSWVNGKLQGMGAHDDAVLSLWIANEASSDSSFSFSFG
jgi:intein/homing endonuclease